MARDIDYIDLPFSEGEVVEGRVFGWNRGGFHVVIEGKGAFCPKSEMLKGPINYPKGFVDRVYKFKVLRIEEDGRIILSRVAYLEEEKKKKFLSLTSDLKEEDIVEVEVSKVLNNGLNVKVKPELEGFIFKAELSYDRIPNIAKVFKVGDRFKAKIQKIDRDNMKIYLSKKATEKDPVKVLEEKFSPGTEVEGKIVAIKRSGAVVDLGEGFEGFLPVSLMNLPSEALPARKFPPGSVHKLYVKSLDTFKKKITLAVPGGEIEAWNKETKELLNKLEEESNKGFQPFAVAFKKLLNQQ